jgi:hypothetical protein
MLCTKLTYKLEDVEDGGIHKSEWEEDEMIRPSQNPLWPLPLNSEYPAHITLQ